MTFLGNKTCVSVSLRLLRHRLGTKVTVTNKCEIRQFATLILIVPLAGLACFPKDYFFLANPVNVGLATARQATSGAHNHCGVWLMSVVISHKSHIVTIKVGSVC